MNAFNVIKFIGAWGCLMGALVCVILIKDTPLAMLLSVMSVAFSQAPSNG